MKLKEIRDDYYFFSGKLSDINRQLMFAGIAVVWTLRLGTGNAVGMEFDVSFIVPMILFVTALLFDFLHYAWGAIATSSVNRKQWTLTNDNDADVDFPSWLNSVTRMLFIAKIFIGLLAQVLLLYYMFNIIL